MGAGEHRHVGEFHRQFADGLGDLAHQRQQHAVATLAEHQGVGQVVDVLGGAGEVDELADRGQLRELGGLFLEQVLHGFHVVVGGALDFLDAFGVFQLEVAGQAVEQGVGFGGERRDLGNPGVGGEALQPADFHHDAETDQAVFAEDRTQAAGFAGIAAIDGGYRGERGKLHETFSWLEVNEKGAHIIHERCAPVGHSAGPFGGAVAQQGDQAGGEDQAAPSSDVWLGSSSQRSQAITPAKTMAM